MAVNTSMLVPASVVIAPWLVFCVPGSANDAAGASEAERESATRLQIFLDRANFGPGKIDGRYGEFTHMALKLYLEAHRDGGIPRALPVTTEAIAADSAQKAAAPARPDPADLDALDLASVDPVFIDYLVTEEDLKEVGALPKEIPQLARLKWLPYGSAGEEIAERFHCDHDFLNELNPGKLELLKAGDRLKVPNVEPLFVGRVKELPLWQELHREDAGTAEGKASKAPATTIDINVQESMLRLLEDGRLVAAYPVTVGSERTKSPVGEWKVKGIARLPDFRYDESMLNEGTRSERAFVLPPGPNNLVGVIWIALDRPGIGIHGTSEPDTIGRSVSHGCVRMANWDIVRLAPRVRIGTEVSIHEGGGR